MRTIKFRIWDSKLQKFYTDKSYPTYDTKDDIYELNELYSTSPGLFYEGFSFILNDSRYVLQQFTGLQDKKGCDIYEGDILSVKTFDGWFDKTGFYYQATVFYDEWRAKFIHANRPELKCGQDFSFEQTNATRDVEVIGNIFQPPNI